MNLRVRKPTTTVFMFPANVVRIIRPSIVGAMSGTVYHFKNRHRGPQHRMAVRNWAAEVKRLDANSAYSTAWAQLSTAAQ